MGESARKDFLDALYICPNVSREEWLYAGMAIHSMDSTETGFELWQQWSKTCEKYDPPDQARVWASFNNKKTEKKTKDYIFGLRKKILEQQKKEEEANKVVLKINEPMLSTQDAIYNTPLVNTYFPVNILNSIATIMESSSYCHSKIATCQAVIALASSLASRNYMTPDKDSCHLYVGIATGMHGTLGELRYTTSSIKTILDQCGLRRVVKSSRIQKKADLYKTLWNSPSFIYLCSDYADILRISKQQQHGYMNEALVVLASLWNEREIQLDNKEETGLNHYSMEILDANPKLYRPSVSMLSLLHYADLAQFAKVSEMGKGSATQFLFAVCDEEEGELSNHESDITLSPEMIEKLLQVKFKGKNTHLIDGDFSLEQIFSDTTLNPSLKQVEFFCDLQEFDAMIDEITSQRRHRAFRADARRNMRRLMTIMAAFDNPKIPVASRQIMEWCAQYVVSNLEIVIDLLVNHSSEDGKLSVRQQVMNAIMRSEKEGIPPSQLVNFSRGYESLSKAKKEELVSEMIDDGDIVLIDSKDDKKRGRPSKRLVWAKYYVTPTTLLK
jgi:hypothetical protein